jgi:hypothetical protein
MSYEFYQLTQAQLDKLDNLCNGDTNVLIVASPLDTDPERTRSVIADNLSMISDLVTLGFLEESTVDYIEALDRVRRAIDGTHLTGREFKAYTVTKIGFQLFHEHSKPKIQ